VGGHGPSSIGLADPYIFQKKTKKYYWLVIFISSFLLYLPVQLDA
jgi:hypothetical protein